jgi:AraC family transcriptional regulator, transcriptional activator of pobA
VSNKDSIEKDNTPSWLNYEGTITVSELSDSSPYIVNPKAHSVQFYEIIWIFEGSGLRIIDGQEFEAKPGRVFFMYPGSVHRWKQTKGLKGVFIAFSQTVSLSISRGSTDSKIPFFKQINNIPYVDINNDESSLKLLDVLRIETNDDSNDNLDMRTTLLNTLLLKFLEHVEFGRHAHHNSLSSKFETLLENNFLDLRKVEDYAKLAHLSPNYFNDKIREETGKSAGWWIRERLLLESKRLLLFSQLSVAEIANQLHIDDVSYFCRFFKKATTQTPLKFRESDSYR